MDKKLRDKQNREKRAREKRVLMEPDRIKWLTTTREHYDEFKMEKYPTCLLYTSPSPRDRQKSRMPSSA